MPAPGFIGHCGAADPVHQAPRVRGADGEVGVQKRGALPPQNLERPAAADSAARRSVAE